jgi:hypothetical protein
LLVGRRCRRIIFRGHGRAGGQKRGCGKEPHGNGRGERRHTRH